MNPSANGAELSPGRSRLAGPPAAGQRGLGQPGPGAAGSPKASASLLWFGLAVVPIVGVLGINGETVLALRVLSAASVLGGLAIFLSHGGRRITAAGMFCLTTGLMAGGGGWYWAAIPPAGTSLDSILLAALSIYGSTLVMYILFWHTSLADRPARAGAPTDLDAASPLPPKLARNLPPLGILVFLVGAGAQAAGFGLGTLAKSAAEVGVIIFGGSLLLGGRTQLFRSPARIFLVGAAMVAFYLAVFSGGGRLRLAAVMITIIVIAQYRVRTPIKVLAVAALVPTLLVFSYIGHTRLAAKAADPTASPAASGLGSLVNPLRTYGQLVDGDITDGHGSTFVAELVVIVPRAFWQGKPDQFGKVIAWKLRPDAAPNGLSMPCTAQCESYYNFAWPGIPLMIPFFGWMLRWLDRRIALRGSLPLDNPLVVFAIMFLATLVGTIADLAWGGTATWAVRNVQRLMVFLPFLLWAHLSSRHHGRASQLPRVRATPGPARPLVPARRHTSAPWPR